MKFKRPNTHPNAKSHSDKLVGQQKVADTTKPARTMKLTKKTNRIALATIGLLVVAALIYQLTADARIAKKPEYTTVLPSGKSVTQLGGWQRVSPPKEAPIFAYIDTIDGVTISVSQQPLPPSFAYDPAAQVADLAKKFNATTKIDAGSTEVYVGTSVKGPQSAILTKHGLLILIKSQQKIQDASWAAYATSLK